jgi:hypothetical protein
MLVWADPWPVPEYLFLLSTAGMSPLEQKNTAQAME